MITIRRIYDEILPVNKEALRQIKNIMRARFRAVTEDSLAAIGESLRNPLKARFRTILYVAENHRKKVEGFAKLLHEPGMEFCFLDYLATAKGVPSRGIGSSLYEVVRDESAGLGAKGLFFECLPDDPNKCPLPELHAENRARLRLYEAYGARPIIGTEYEKPIRPQDVCMPFLVYDGLNRQEPLRRDFAKAVVRTILEVKYGSIVTPGYVKTVVDSFRDDPIRIRPFRYTKPPRQEYEIHPMLKQPPISLVVNDRHNIHHVRERGYVESPVRIPRIMAELDKTNFFKRHEPYEFPMAAIKSVHDEDFVEYLRRVCANVPEGRAIYPYVFPIRNKARPPKELSVRAGYYCIDTFTPLNLNAFLAARRAVDCTLTAARLVLEGGNMAYSLVRPPGHHAERRVFGGFCYFNNTAIATQFLSSHGKVAILDVDYHHGNGQQNIFYDRPDVLTISIHGHADFAYPYFTGFQDETGKGSGKGFNINIPLAETIDGNHYVKALAKALRTIKDFNPMFLVVALGLDTAKIDPTGTWLLVARDFFNNGRMIGEMGFPTLVVQEGGYRTRTLGINARAFFEGLIQGRQSREFHKMK